MIKDASPEAIAELHAKTDAYRAVNAWLRAHREELTRQYPDQWVAVTTDGVIAVADDHVTLHRMVRETEHLQHNVATARLDTRKMVLVL